MTSALDYFRDLPDGPDKQPFLGYLGSFDHPEQVADEIRALIESDDDLVAPPELFFQRPGEQLFENWDYPVIARTFHEEDEGRLLCLPPGADRFREYRRIMPTVMERQLEVNYPRLKSELANRPNLLFPGVFYPDEIEIRNMEMISLKHGRNYVVRADLELEGSDQVHTVVLKPASMGVEAVITSTIHELNRRMPTEIEQDVGPIQVPSIVSVDDKYGILEFIPGQNGVETLSDGINTGTIHTLKSNEYPEDFQVSEDGLLNLADEFAKQAACAFYLRLYDRKPDQLIFNHSGNGEYRVTHIDFGRAIKRNFALPWKRYYATQRAPLVFEDHEIPYFEAAASLIFIPHFIPASLKSKYSPFEGQLREQMKSTFVELANFFQKNVEVIEEHFQYLIGENTQFNSNEVHGLAINQKDVDEVRKALLSLDPPPEEVFDSVINLAHHEHNGSTPTISDSDEEGDDTIYRRMARPGGESRKLAPRADGDHPYEMASYEEGGSVYYDRDRRSLNIEFGSNPNRVINHVRDNYSPRLAEFIEQFPEIQPGVEVTVLPDGRSNVTVPPGLTRTDIDFPEQAIQQFRQVVSGFAPTHHVKQYIDNYLEWKNEHAETDFIQEETQKQTIAFANNLEGKEVLQSYQLPGEETKSIHQALSEVIRHILSNPDYLADKDPLKSVNQLIMSLGQKYELVEPLGEQDRPDELLETLFDDCFDLYNNRVPTEHFRENTPPHVIHVRTMLRLTRFFVNELDLDPDQRQLLWAATLLHDLSVLEPEFAQLLSDPNGRLNRPIFEDYLASHTELTIDKLEEHQGETFDLPSDLDRNRLRDLLANHHSSERDDTLHQLLHLIDNLAVFSDHTRPGHWTSGYLRLRDLAPQWIDSQRYRDRISPEIHRATKRLFGQHEHSILDDLDYQSHNFPELSNALHMAAALHNGLDPQNPGLLDDLRDRHGEKTVDGIWSRVLRSYLPAGEKIRVIRRIDELAPLLSRENVDDYAFINASPRPIQLAVELIRHHLNKDRLVILMGIFPRVTKAYRRFLKQHRHEFAHLKQNIVAISGPRRLQFIRHSYPFEADFEQPFHQIIQEYREEHERSEDLCFIPFQEFHEFYEPTKEATTRIRQLEKVSELEEQTVPEQVKTEGQRYRLWKKKQPSYAIDTLENERFRRILLNNFTNREVLYFYQRTIDERPNVKVALREVLGALRENPNYLSERNSRYSLHELVRSLSQIHFFSGNRPRAYDILDDHLDKIGVHDRAPYFDLLDRYGEELNFFKNTLGTALTIMDELATSFSGLSREAMVFALLGCGIMCEEDGLRDYLLSPEDISYNRGIRRRLVSHTVRIAERLFDTDAFHNLPGNVQEDVRSLMKEAHPSGSYALTQTSLYLAMFLDYSRVENWERGRRIVSRQDIETVLSPLETMMPRHVPEAVTADVMTAISDLIDGEGIQQLNKLSRPTYSYIYLFNALSLARDLRYGLFPEGHSPFQNTRLLYGVNRTNRLIKGMVESDLSAPEAVKICRKIRYLASGLKRHPENPTDIYFLNLDRTGSWQLPPMEDSDHPMLLLSGGFRNCLKFWDELKERHPDAIPYTHTLIGEEFPVLLKETSLSYTDFLKERISKYRRDNKLVGRHLMMPIRELFEDAPERPEPVVMSYQNLPPGLFINAWLALFDM